MTARRPMGPVAVNAWNLRHPVGSEVVYWPFARIGEGVLSKVRLPARILSSGHAVVWVEGRADAIALSHVEAFKSASAEVAS